MRKPTQIKIEVAMPKIAKEYQFMKISEFIKKRHDEKIAAKKSAEEQIAREVNGAYKNIAMLLTNSEVWKDVTLLPGVMFIEVSEDAIKLFKDSMKILGKEAYSFFNGRLYKSFDFKNTLTLECSYSLENIDDIIDAIVKELCERASTDRSEIEQIGKSFNEISPII